MTLKKKVIVGTLATTMAVTAFAGLPLSSKGLAEKLGVGVASAMTVSEVQGQLNAIKLNLSAAGKTSLHNLYDDLSQVSKTQHVANFQPLIQNMPSAIVGTDAQQQALVDLFVNSGALFFPPNVDGGLDALKNDANVQALIESLQGPSGLNMDITIDGLAEFSMGVIADINSVMGSYSAEDLLDPEKRYAAAKQVFDTEIVKDTEGANIYKAIRDTYFGGSSEDLFAALKEVYHNYDGSYSKLDLTTALVAVANAYKTANSTPIGGGGGGSSSTVNLTQLLSDLSALKSKLATATDAEKKALIEKAIKDANAVAAALADIDVSGFVITNGDNATLTVATGTVTKLVDGIKQLKAALVDAIGSADGFVVPVASLNLGNIAAPNVTSSAAADVLSKLAEAGIPGVAFTAAGLTATLPIDGDFAKGIDFTSKKSAATEGQTKGKTAVSDVYNFSLKLGGSDVEKFAKPITIKFPVKDVAGVDKELLSVARIEADGSLSIQGGSVEGQTISENRHQFSSYVVVENKVNFNDIGTVQAWAGRQIEVVAAKGAIQGKATGVFAPRDDITRAEFAKILVTALDLDNADAMSSKFTDVNSSDWFAPYVAVAVENGIINGRTATSFDPKATITRAEISTMIARALVKVKGVADVADADKALAAFSDAASINSTLKGGVALAASENIVIGDNGKFRPNDKASRAEAAVMIYRTLNTKAE